MKKITRFSLSVFIAVAAFINPLKAQDATKELAAFAKQFETLYNKKDDKALKEMYMKDAVRTGTDGKVSTGSEEIRALYAEYFKDSVTVEIKPGKATTAADGSAIATGNFYVKGTSAKGEKVERYGGYTNTMVKEHGHWKILKQVLTAL